MPPFGRLVRLIARGPEESAVYAYLKELAAALRQAADPSVRVLGPAPAPILKIRNLYRFHLQLRCPSAAAAPGAGARPCPPRLPPPAGRRAGHRRRPDQHAVMQSAWLGRIAPENSEKNSRKPAKSGLQLRPIGVSSARSFTPWTRDDGTHGRVSTGQAGGRDILSTVSLPLVFGPDSAVAPSLADEPGSGPGRGCDRLLSRVVRPPRDKTWSVPVWPVGWPGVSASR